MMEAEIYDWLNQAGIDTPRWMLLGQGEIPVLDFYPVALKIHSPKVIHKSDVGGVALGIASSDDLYLARDAIARRLLAHGITLDTSDQFIAVEMVEGEELYAGIVRDEIFGPVILFGKGGILLELYKDICYIDIKADEAEIERAIKTTRISKLFEGYRGCHVTMEDAVSFIRKIQKLYQDNPTIQEFDLNPTKLTSRGLIAVDARIKFGSNEDAKPVVKRITTFFDNKRVAVIGASNDQTKVGYAVAKNSLSFRGELFFVNRKGGELFGRPLYKEIKDIPGEIDTAVITIPGKLVIDALKELIAKGVRNVIIISAGFKEAGGADAEKEIEKLAREHNLNVIGPNCLGYFEATKRLNLTFAASSIESGGVALISQSGAVLTGLMDKAWQAKVGFSHVVSVGNMVDLNFAETIMMLQDEPSCEAISIYAEGIRNGKEFLDAIRHSRKPIYLFKVGKSNESKKAAFSHTGNLSGNYEMFEGLFKSVGVHMVDNIEALLYAPRYKASEVLVVTNAGGPAAILTDYIVGRGKKMVALTPDEMSKLDAILPSNWSRGNPVDIIGDAMSGRYKQTLEVIASFGRVELLYLVVTPQFMTDIANIARLCLQEWPFQMIPILLGGEVMEEAKALLRSRRILYFESLKEATDFL